MKTFKTPKGTELPLMDLRGKEYLQVAHRLVWFREERPDFSITTEVLNGCVKATIAGPLSSLTQPGQVPWVLATAHKTIGDKIYALESAETGAIGRALAMCGFGTQFCGDDLEEGDEIADSPIDAAKYVAQAKKDVQHSAQAKQTQSKGTPGAPKKVEPSPKATKAMLDEMWERAEYYGWSKKNVKEYFSELGVNKSEDINQIQLTYFLTLMRNNPKIDLERDAIEKENRVQ